MVFSYKRLTRIETEGRPKIGMNLPVITYYGAQMFVDRIKQAPHWKDLSGSDNWTLDSNGELTSVDASDVEVTLMADAGSGSDGRYTLTWDGAATFQHLSGGATQVSSSAGELVFDYVAGDSVYVRFDTSSGVMTNMHMWNHDEETAYLAGNRFRTMFTQYLDPDRFSVLRFMDWGGVNSNAFETNWSQRCPDTYRTFSRGTRSASLESIMALSNQVGISPWLCLPIAASDDYITQYAAFVRDNLESDLTPRFELSNEVWNPLFGAQFGYAEDQAADLFGDAAYSDQWYAMRTVQMAQIIDDVMNVGLRRNFKIWPCWHKAQANSASDWLEAPQWAAADPDNYVAPHTMFDAVGIAGYYGSKVWTEGSIAPTLVDGDTSPTISHLANNILPTYISEQNDTYLAWQGALADYDLPLVIYEGGGHMTAQGVTLNTNLIDYIYSGDFSGFTAGETVDLVFGAVTLSGIIVSRSASSCRVEITTSSTTQRATDPDSITGQTSLASVSSPGTTSSYLRATAKAALEDFQFSSEHSAIADANRDNFFAVGLVGDFCEFTMIAKATEFANFGRAPVLTDTLYADYPTWAGMWDYSAANPRTWLNNPRKTTIA
jgi:hypothetical protein